MSSATGHRRISVMRRDSVALVVLARGDAEVASWPLPGCGRPDLAVVGQLVKLQLGARRLGCAIYLRDAPPALVELLLLVGLADVVPCRPALRQVGGETEGGEQVGVEEVVVPHDPLP
jgi:ABC-type transporter Mla MlaB component